MVKIFLDNNVFDFLYEKKIDIFQEFLKDGYEICMVKEVDFESELISDPNKCEFVRALKDKIILKQYFGFYDDRHESSKQRVGGFDNGEYMSCDEGVYYKELLSKFHKSDEKRKTDLYKNEADIILAVRSIKNIVLTNDKKKGPLKNAFDKGYNIIFLNGYFNGRSLYDYVTSRINP